MRTISFTITDEEYPYLIGMVSPIQFTCPDLSLHAINVINKLTVALIEQASPEEIEFLRKILSSLQHVLSEPSIERGMYRGGIDGLIDKAIEHINKNEP